jgi:hypothetical protein
MVAEPEVAPVTTPEELTDAIDELLLVQVPPEVVSVKVAVKPMQMMPEPVMIPAPAEGVTVTGTVVKELPQPVVTV